ncbi:tyrosine protein phosphatase [Isosphaeraceae bacterium EP7]
MTTTRRTWLRRGLGLALIAFACQQAWRHGHDYVFADQFAEIEPGKVYRGAWQKPWPMERIVRDRKIKTIVALAHPDDHPLAKQEKAFSERMGVRWVHIPIVEQRVGDDPEEVSDKLEQAAAIVADPANQPVYFHCHHGINRASMVQIAYRTMFCGWTMEQAHDEIARTFGLVTVSKGPDYRHMKSFYDERVLPRRRAEAEARTAQLGNSGPTR